VPKEALKINTPHFAKNLINITEKDQPQNNERQKGHTGAAINKSQHDPGQAMENKNNPEEGPVKTRVRANSGNAQ
jgi:hypothetical protein